MHSEDASSSISEEIVSPVTTDSMVTVPLSDRQSMSADGSADLDIPTTPVDGKGDQFSFFTTVKETDLTPKNEAVGRTDEAFIRENRTRSSTSLNDAPDITHEGYESSSSTESDGGVDWEKLDKSEEQEPRTEGSDEVRNILKSI